MSFIGVRLSLYNTINAIKTSAGIQTLCNYNPVELGATPAVLILPERSGEQIITTDENESSIRFVIRVLVQNTNDPSTQTTSVLTVTDAIMAELRKNDNESLAGTCHYFLMEEITPVMYGEFAEVKVMYQDIVITAKTLMSISTP